MEQHQDEPVPQNLEVLHTRIVAAAGKHHFHTVGFFLLPPPPPPPSSKRFSLHAHMYDAPPPSSRKLRNREGGKGEGWKEKALSRGRGGEGGRVHHVTLRRPDSPSSFCLEKVTVLEREEERREERSQCRHRPTFFSLTVSAVRIVIWRREATKVTTSVLLTLKHLRNFEQEECEAKGSQPKSCNMMIRQL